jgi:hypothetical protein
MRIENLRTENNEGRARVAATVVWEDCNRPAEELYFETYEKFADSLTCNPDAFLVASAVPAMHYGEKRIFMEERVCPELRSGLLTAMSFISHWFQSDRKLPEIQTSFKNVLPGRKKPERAGFFFSGGIDSFATLRANRLDYPPEHPLYIKDGLIVHGLEMASTEAFDHVLGMFSRVEKEIGITLIPVYTNVYLPYRTEDERQRFSFWEYEFIGSALSSVAHAFANRFSSVSISATFSLTIPVPYGSHPLVDPNFSSTDLRIRHDGFVMTRLSKAKLIAGWEPALRNLRVCNQFKKYKEGIVNCCGCEKCIRTMLELMALGVLDKTEAFEKKDISGELLKGKVKVKGASTELSYKELIVPLLEIGRSDLVEVIRQKIAEYHSGGKWKERMKYFDGKHLSGSLLRLKKFMSAVLE